MNLAFDREQLYLRLPRFLQNLVVSLEGSRLIRRRYDFAYEELFKEVSERTFILKEELDRYRNTRLRHFFSSASNVPYWKEKFSRYEVDIRAPDMMAELLKLPILGKAEVKSNFEQIVNKGVANETVSCHTSGTTGSGLVFPVTRAAEREQWATWWRYRNWHGIDQSMWCGYFGGRSIVTLGRKRPPYWRINRSGRQLMFSAYHLSEGTAKAYIRALAEHAIQWLHGYPSVLALLAGFVRDQGISSLPPVKVITTGAENLLPSQRRVIKDVFGAPVFQHYGQAERSVNMSECEYGRLHVDEDFSLVEFIPKPEANGSYCLVGTNWTNPAFPLIRYDTGDIATLSSDQCACRRPGRLVDSIDGRQEDYLILPNGVKVGRLDHIFKDLVHVLEAQIIQFEPGQAVFRIIKGKGFDDAREEKKLLSEARKRLGEEIRLKIEYTDHIGRTSSGKLRFVVSHVPDGILESQALSRKKFREANHSICSELDQTEDRAFVMSIFHDRSHQKTEKHGDPVSFYDNKAACWELKYRKISFQNRLRAFLSLLAEQQLEKRKWLDAGCGTGTIACELASRGCVVTGVDASSRMIQTARRFCRERGRAQLDNPVFHVDTIERLDFQQGSFDGIVCSSVLEYVDNPSKALAQFYRVLAPGGLLLVSVPNRKSLLRNAEKLLALFLKTCFKIDWPAYLAFSRHSYTHESFSQLLYNHGFRVTSSLGYGPYLPAFLSRGQSTSSLILFLAKKEGL